MLQVSSRVSIPLREIQLQAIRSQGARLERKVSGRQVVGDFLLRRPAAHYHGLGDHYPRIPVSVHDAFESDVVAEQDVHVALVLKIQSRVVEMTERHQVLRFYGDLYHPLGRCVEEDTVFGALLVVGFAG